jgi:hypothetical protein
MSVRNLGIAMTTMPTSNAGMEEIPLILSGHASAISNWVRNVFGSFAIALFSSMLASYVPAHAIELAKQGVGSKQTIQLLSFTMSVNDVYLVATIISLIALPFTFFVGKQSPKKMDKPSQEVA